MSFCNSQAETNEVINQLRFKFDSNWSAVNFGEKIISSYMNFCTSKHEFQPAFWDIVNHNLRQDLLLRIIHGNIFIFFRKRCLNFLTSVDLFKNMPVQAIFRMLRENLYNVSMLAYIYVTNLGSAEDELQFIMGSKDYGKILCFLFTTKNNGLPCRSMELQRQDGEHWSATQSDDSVLSL